VTDLGTWASRDNRCSAVEARHSTRSWAGLGRERRQRRRVRCVSSPGQTVNRIGRDGGGEELCSIWVAYKTFQAVKKMYFSRLKTYFMDTDQSGPPRRGGPRQPLDRPSPFSGCCLSLIPAADTSVRRRPWQGSRHNPWPRSPLSTCVGISGRSSQSRGGSAGTAS
jgi:hypothetical protein